MKFAYLIAAIFAAIFEHRSMEALSSAGLFASEYGSYRHTSVVPTVLGAVVLLVVLAIVAYRDRGADVEAGDWVTALAARAKRVSFVRAFASILALQLVTLFTMESIEQLASSGHLEGGASFLGGPLAIALVVAALVALGVCAAIRETLSALVATVETLVRAYVAYRFFLDPPAKGLVLATLAIRADVSRVPVLANRSGLRAPPHTR